MVIVYGTKIDGELSLTRNETEKLKEKDLIINVDYTVFDKIAKEEIFFGLKEDTQYVWVGHKICRAFFVKFSAYTYHLYKDGVSRQRVFLKTNAGEELLLDLLGIEMGSVSILKARDQS
jgi:hypothetical protein